MSIHIQCKNNPKENAKVQSVPFKIYADCDARVSKYFDTYVKEDQKGKKVAQNGLESNLFAVLSTSFRGYPLKGSKIELPEGYVGLVLHESLRPCTEKEERNFYVINKFNSFINWNWDKAPSRNDKIVQALEWIEIAEALHTPILEE